MKRFIIIGALLCATPAYAVGFGTGLAGYGASRNSDWQENMRRQHEENMQREALFEQQEQNRIMREQLNQQRYRQNRGY